MKYLLIALAVLALVAAVFAKVEHGRAEDASAKAVQAQEDLRNTKEALTHALDQAALLRSSSLARQKELNRLRQQSAAQQKALNEALQANPDWARAAVPDGVLDALTAPLGGAGQAGPGLDRARAGAATARP